MTDTCPTCGVPTAGAVMEQVHGNTWATVLRPCGHTLLEDV